MRTQESPVVFECKGQQIVGMLHLPAGRGRFPSAMLLHGLTGTKCEVHRMFVKLARQLAENGIACLRFDFRGSGDSAGEFEQMTVRSEVTDAMEALRFLGRHKRLNSRRVALVGMSLGGAIAAHVAAKESARVKALVLWAPVAEGAKILDGLATPDAVASLAQRGVTNYHGNLIGMSFIRQFADMKPVREAARAKCPTLILHGAKDEIVPVQHADMYEHALQAAKREVTKIIIPGADHAFSRPLWETRLITETVNWLGKTL